jgi:hypothetical protein
MFSTFADVFGSDDHNTKQDNGSNNPFDSSTTTVDPFGISSDMKLSASSQRFDDSPFIVETTTSNDSNRFDNGKDAFSSSTNWNNYQNSNEESSLDPLENLQTKSTSLTIHNNITHSKSINLINPFSIPTMTNETSTVPIQASPIDLLFDLNVDPSTLPTINSDKSLTNSDQVQSSYDLLGLNKKSNPTPAVKILKSDSLTDLPKLNQTKKSSPSTSLNAKSNIPTATSFHSIPIHAPTTSPSTLRVQATALSILTGTTSTTPFDDQFLDWLTQSDDLMCGVDPKLSGLSKKIDINMLKSTEDLLGSICRQPPPPAQTLPAVQEVVPVQEKQTIRRPSIEDIPSICIHEPTNDHDDSNIVPQGYFDNQKKKKVEKDSDDSEDEKMVFKIEAKKLETSSYESNISVPFLPPPPSPSTTKKYKEASDDASSSSSETEDENDPLAVFRPKSIKNKTNQKQGNNLITDWDEQDDTKIDQEEERVCLMLSHIYVLLSRSSYDRNQGWCGLLNSKFFLCLMFLVRENSCTSTASTTSRLLFT